MIYEMGSKSQEEEKKRKRRNGGERKRKDEEPLRGKKEAKLFQVRDEDRIIKQSYSAPTEREAIRVRTASPRVFLKTIFRSVRRGTTRRTATPRRAKREYRRFRAGNDSRRRGRRDTAVEETRRLWIFDAVKPGRASHKSNLSP